MKDDIENDRVTAVKNLLKAEAEKITDEGIRLIALRFCILVAFADGEFEEQEGAYINVANETWKSMKDGWDYTTKDAVDKAMAD